MSSIELQSRDTKILAAIEEHFWLHSKMPSVDELVKKTYIDYKNVLEILETPEFRKKLVDKGIINGYQAERLSSYLQFLEIAEQNPGLDPLQVVVANMILNTTDRRSERKKLEEAGVSPQRYAAWKNQPEFKEYLKKRAQSVFGDLDVAAHMSMSRMIADDNVQAVKLFYEMTGLYTPKSEVNVKVNVNLILVKIVEVIARHVEPEVAIKIADAIEVETRELMK